MKQGTSGNGAASEGLHDEGETQGPIAAVSRDQAIALSYAQDRYWLLSLLEPDSTTYHLATAIRLRGSLRRDALKAALAQVVLRHEALRTVVATQEGKPLQRILPTCNPDWLEIDVRATKDPAVAVHAASADLRSIPFDLTRPPLVRGLLARVAEDEHVLVLVAHRMVADERAMAILVRDLGLLYGNQGEAQPQKLPDLPLQFADFASWQCAASHGDGFAKHASFWKETLAGTLPVLDLASDFPRPPRTTYGGKSVAFSLPAPLVQSLEPLCARTGSDVFTLYVSALALVLSRHSGLQEIVLGMPAANRVRPETQAIMGRLATMLPLRLDTSAKPSVSASIEKAKEVIEQARRHQEIPFERILEELTLPRDLGRHPLFQVVVDIPDDDVPVPTFAGLAVEEFAMPHTTVMFDLHVRLQGGASGITGSCTYATALYKEERVARLLAQVERALQWMAEHADEPTAAVDFIDQAEKVLLLETRNATQRDFPVDQHVHECFEAQVARTPDALAVVCGDRTLSYADLNASANRLARHLQQLEIGCGDRVGICMERSVDTVVALLATIKAGAIYVPIDPQYPLDRQAYMIAEAEAKVVLGQEHLAERIPGTQARVVLVDSEAESWAVLAADNLPRLAPPHPLLYMIFTSGSTGKPKGSLVFHRGFVNLLTWYRDEFAFDDKSRFLVFSSLSFDLTQKNLFAPLVSGGTLVLLDTPHYDAARILDLIDQHAVTLTNCTPSAFYGLLANESETSLRKLRSLRYVVLGGENISLPRLGPWLSAPWCQATVVNSYGPTECTDVCAFHQLGDARNYPTAIPIGRPITNTQLYILDSELRLVPDGATGELCIGGAGVGAGYVNRPELNTQKFVANPFAAGSSSVIYRTGDRVRYLASGDIEFLGRIDHQVKIRGFRIELGEITAALERLPEVKQVYVMPREDAAGDLSLVAYLVPAGTAAEVSIPSLRGRLAEVLPDYMVPTAFVTLEALPLSPNGKVDRTRLPAPQSAPAPTATATGAPRLAVPPRSEAEAFIAERWQTLLGVAHVGNNERFFDLGGTSLKAIQFMGAMGQELGIALPMVTLFESPTVAQFVATVRRRFPEAFAKRFPGDQVDVPVVATTKKITQPAAVPNTRPDIAIIGMAVRLPGAQNLDEFWQNLRNGVESVRTLSDEELRRAGVDDELLANPSYVKAAAAMDHIEDFDAGFFRMLPREVELMDPQQRAILECAWSALDHGGYASAAMDEHKVGVFAGVARDAYLTGHLLTHPNLMQLAGDYSMMIGNEKDFPATRVAYRLDLRGPALNIQTACSSSGVGLHFACQSLQLDDCDMVLVGGCRVLTPVAGYLYVDGGTLAPDGHVRAFDADGHGMVRGSGVAFVLLKRLDRALVDRDRVYAVIKGTAINNDGAAKVGYTAPGVVGQSAVIRAALAKASVHPDTISYVEAHGTGTSLGDPIEITALTDAYRAFTARKGYCAVGSVKTNIGHLDAGSCVAGVIKTVLSLCHQELPPSLNYKTPNPQIDFANSPFFVNAQLRPWKSDNGPRRAGVSSFGLGGTNAHVILEEAPAQDSGPGRPNQLLVLSAKTATALDSATDNLALHLERHPEDALADVAFTLQTSRSVFAHRRMLVCPSNGEASAAVRTRRDCRSGEVDAKRPPSFMFMFPGQGAQHVGMGRDLYRDEPLFKETVDTCAEHLKGHLHLDLRDVIFPSPGQEEAASERLNQTALAQPALFVVGYAMARMWTERHIVPQVMIGHSVGEFAAACLAGVFTLEDSLRILAERARLMQSMPPGSMCAVRMSEEALAPYLRDGLSLAAVNAPSLCVLSGSHEAIAAFDETMKAMGSSTVALHTSHAFHSSMMDPIVPAFAKAVEAASRSQPTIPIVSTVTGTWLTPEQAVDPAYWASQLRQPVRFSQAFTCAQGQGDDNRVFIDVGPSTNLATSAQRHLPTSEAGRVINSLPRASDKQSDAATFLAATGRCWLLGATVDWRILHEGERRLRVGLPSYPFERKRYWIEPKKTAASEASTAVPAPATESTTDPVTMTTAMASTTTPAVALPGNGTYAPANGMAQVFAEQLELMSRQLDLLTK